MKVLSSIALLLVFTFSVKASEPLPTVPYVNLDQYVGKWYAITSLPQFFTKDCEAQTAEYAIKDAKTVTVLNTCIKKNGSTRSIRGEAEVVNLQTNAELVVIFDNFWTKLFRVKGDYNVIKLDESYSTVLVGSKNRKSLWLLSRTPYVSDEVKKEFIDYAKSLNFKTSKMIDSHF